MSGLEGLAALGLACNIFQAVSFGRETLVLVKDIYHNGKIDDSLEEKSTAIQEVVSDIIAVEIPRPFGKHEQKLFEVTKKCTGFARGMRDGGYYVLNQTREGFLTKMTDLKEEIAFLKKHNAKGSLLATLKTATQVNWRKRRLQRMERDLADSEQLMQSTLLAWIFKSLHTTSINIDGLEESVRHFVIKYNQGHRQTSELVSKEALQVRETIVRESGKTEMVIRDHVTQTSAKAERRFKDHITQTNKERLQKRLLDSLKYPGMNERANQIEGAHAHTFRWLFADQDYLNDSNDEQHTEESQAIDEEDSDVSSEKSGYSASTYSSDDEYDDENSRPDMVWSSFTDWLQSNLSIYWIMGKPGSGKSTLAKFILSEPRTKILLEKWRSDVIVMSHYFWRPGSIMQQSIKGMFCSIAHQLVFAIPNALQYASLNVQSFDSKDAHTDWKVSELQQLCLGLIRHFGKPLCLLIDGLDECSPGDDHQELLDILESFKSHDVKIIASSRNEPVFERRFRHQPQLRIQDLTDGDLRSYAADKLHNEIQEDDSFASDLVKKSEGVFLWLILAVQSLNRGFGNGDSFTDLRKRMENLPKRLNDLYKDMWERLNDDKDIYRTDAALYFRLAIAAADQTLLCMTMGFSIMDMMLASSETSHDGSAEISSMVSAGALLEQCERFRINVEVRCAGLLSTPISSTEPELQGSGDTERELLGYAHRKRGFRFIHRSARDFLDTDDGRNILQYEGRSSETLKLRVVGAGLRAAELLHPILKEARKRNASAVHYNYYSETEVDKYLVDLSRLAGDTRRDSAVQVEALFSRYFELYTSSILLPDPFYNGACPARIASFFGFAALYPELDRHSTNTIEKRLAGRGVMSAVLLAVVEIGSNHSSGLPLMVARWVSSLNEVDVNQESPLVAFRPYTIPVVSTPNGMGPLDHIKASPFTRLLGFGLINLDWKPIRWERDLPGITEFLQLVCDFVSHGGNLRSTLFLACPDRWDRHRRQLGRSAPRLFEMPGWDFRFCWDEDDDRVLCVLALEAAVVIQRMLDCLLKTCADHESSEEIDYGSRNDAVGDSDLEAAVSFLAKRCEEYGCGAKAHVVGLLQPCGNFADMPYRQVTHQDSDNLIKGIWTYMDAPRPGGCWDNLVIQIREVVARSPFSSIGFRDYLSDRGHFDELAAHRLYMEYEEDIRH